MSVQKGLSSEEARQRLDQNGYNVLEDTGKKSILPVFAGQFKDFLVLVLLAAAVVSAVLGDGESAAVIFAVVLLNAVLGTVQHVKAENSLDSLKALSAPEARVLRDDTVVSIPSGEIVVGDLVFLEAGDYVCADGEIVTCASLKTNESILTGESESVEKHTGEKVFSGTFAVYGRAEILVTGTAMDTEVGKIAALLKNTTEGKTPLQTAMDNFGRKLSIGILAVCAGVFVLSVLRREPVFDAFMFAVALAVAAIPEALSSIVTIVLAFGTRKLAKENAIIRKLQAVEGLGSVSVICSDKTGTLTQNKMTIAEVFAGFERAAAQQYTRGTDVFKRNRFNIEDTASFLMLASVLCNDGKVTDEKDIGDPTETAMVRWVQSGGADAETIRSDYPRIGELPFDSDRKLMSTVHEIGGRRRMLVKGAPDVILKRLDHVSDHGCVRPVTRTDLEKITAAYEQFSKRGLRVLAFAFKDMEAAGETKTVRVQPEDENHLTFLGLLAMMDPPREASRPAVEKCIAAGIRPVMITGDHKVTAAAIARQVGILGDAAGVSGSSGTVADETGSGRAGAGETCSDYANTEGIAVDGSEIDAMTDEQLEDFVPKVSVYARVTPEHKIRIVRAWQQKGHIVAMTGDGVNDAPALKQADIGVAMGITGSEVAKDAAAMVLADDNFATIVKAVENGRNIYDNIRKSVKFLLSGNAAGIIAVLAASVMGLALPFAPVHLLFINLLTDSLPAIALGLEPHSPEVMRRKPRSGSEGILTKQLLGQICAEGLVIAAASMTGYFIGLQTGYAWAMTMAFAVLCMSRLFHGFSCKQDGPVLFSKRMWQNKYGIGAWMTGMLLLNAVLFIPQLHHIFEIASLTAAQTGWIYGLSLGSMLAIQLGKKILKGFGR